MVIAVAAKQAVITVAASDSVGVRAAIKKVVVAFAIQLINSGTAPNLVVAVATKEATTHRGQSSIVPSATDYPIVARSAVEHVNAVATIEQIIPVLAKKAGRAEPEPTLRTGIVAVAAEEAIVAV